MGCLHEAQPSPSQDFYFPLEIDPLKFLHNQKRIGKQRSGGFALCPMLDTNYFT